MPQIKELARLSGAVYCNPKDGDIFGNQNQRRAIKSFEKGGFYAALYETHGSVVLAFRGTDGISDIGTDLSLYFGNWQIGSASRISAEIAKSHPNVVFTGHSLGGFLAQVACAATGRPCVSFNGPAFRTNPTNTVLGLAAIGSLAGTAVGVAILGAQRARDWYHDLDAGHLARNAWHIYHVRDPISSFGQLVGRERIAVPDPDSPLNPKTAHSMKTLYGLLSASDAIGSIKVR